MGVVLFSWCDMFCLFGWCCVLCGLFRCVVFGLCCVCLFCCVCCVSFCIPLCCVVCDAWCCSLGLLFVMFAFVHAGVLFNVLLVRCFVMCVFVFWCGVRCCVVLFV